MCYGCNSVIFMYLILTSNGHSLLPFFQSKTNFSMTYCGYIRLSDSGTGLNTDPLFETCLCFQQTKLHMCNVGIKFSERRESFNLSLAENLFEILIEVEEVMNL